jgi:hypothetical protein
MNPDFSERLNAHIGMGSIMDFLTLAGKNYFSRTLREQFIIMTWMLTSTAY